MKKTIGVLIIILISGCSWFEGPPGPAGEDGEDGVANMHTEEFSISSSNTEFSEGVGLNEINVPEITQAVIDRGVVRVEFGGIEDAWFGLPWTFGNDFDNDLSVDQTVELNYGYEFGTLYIAHISSYPALLESQIQEGPYKLIVMPPTVNSSSKAHIIKGPPASNF